MTSSRIRQAKQVSNIVQQPKRYGGRSMPVPTYFFDLKHGDRIIRDDEGGTFLDLDAARRYASESARELISQAALEGLDVLEHEIIIRDEGGASLEVMRYREALRLG